MPTKKRSSAVDRDAPLRQHLLDLLTGGHAHADFDTATRNIPPGAARQAAQRRRAFSLEILEHMRIAQWDILEFLARSRPPIAGVARRLLAGDARAAGRKSVGQERARISPRSDGDVRSGRQSVHRSLRQNPAWRRANDPARGVACGRSQRLPSWRNGAGAPPARNMEVRKQGVASSQ